MGWFSSAVSFVSGAVSSIASGLSAAFSTAVSAVVSAGSAALGVVQSIAQTLGIFQSGEKIEEAGDKALHASEAGIRPANYASHAEYMNELRSFEIDPAKADKYTPEQKKAAGVTVAMMGISDKFGMSEHLVSSMMMLVAANPAFFGAARMVAALKMGSGFVENMVDYFANDLNPVQSKNAEQAMWAQEQQINPSSSEDEFLAEVDRMLEEVKQKQAGADL